jgi:predicted DCC family thiol-disulfide oxidoreductase YuxK
MTLERPLLVFDGDCGFCRRRVERLRKRTGERVEYAPYQEAAGRLPSVPIAEFERAVQLRDTDGAIYPAAHGAFRTLAHGGVRWPLFAYRHVPGFRWATELGYRCVAQHRTGISRAEQILFGATFEPPSYAASRRLFLRLLALVYVCAFFSLGTQIAGLRGPDGIVPVGPELSALHRMLGAEAYYLAPTLCWIDAGSTFLRALCWSGVGIAVLLFLDLAPALCALCLWALYLSLTVAGGDFLNFQWDYLLLEAGLLAVFLAPWRLARLGRDRARDGEPPVLARYLLWWLLFRLMFGSGVVKLASGDPTWRSLSALQYHYETQPLPTIFGWFAHRAPEWFQSFSVGVMFAIQLGVPFLIFTPRRIRRWGCALMIGLESLILLTGNYGFFNLLSIAMCLSLLDDSVLRRFVPRRWRTEPAPPTTQRPGRAQATLTGVWAALVALVTGLQIADFVRPADRTLEGKHIVRWIGEELEPLRSISTYGLFARMTMERREIVVQGSNDGVEWRDYEFKFKPDRLDRPPCWVTPHMPRLDWQMWFAALGGVRANSWFERLLARLLVGKRDVLDLLASDPFPDGPPRQIRALLYRYRFTTNEERRASGNWWKREELGTFFPATPLRDG